jgi:hypothetical protein
MRKVAIKAAEKSLAEDAERVRLAAEHAEQTAEKSLAEDAERVRLAAKHAEQTAETHTRGISTALFAAIGGIVLVAVLVAMRRKHH